MERLNAELLLDFSLNQGVLSMLEKRDDDHINFFLFFCKVLDVFYGNS